jgi:hypothetical protein
MSLSTLILQASMACYCGVLLGCRKVLKFMEFSLQSHVEGDILTGFPVAKMDVLHPSTH